MLNGAVSEEIVVPEAALLPAPKTLTFAESAASPVGYETAYHGLGTLHVAICGTLVWIVAIVTHRFMMIVTRGQLKKGETLLVTGAAGGMGTMAIQVHSLALP